MVRVREVTLTRDNSLVINPDIAQAETLPSRFYSHPDCFEAQKESVFSRSWQFVGDTDQVKIPGQVLPFTMLEGCLDEPLLLTRDTNDKLHCLSNVCTHRGNLVAESPGNERFLRCRYHGRRFGLDGKFQFMPEFNEVQGFPCDKDSLPVVPFGIWGKFVFASINPTVSFESFISEIERRVGWMPFDQFTFDSTRQRDYLVRANWALYCDNYLEGFHIPFIHAELNEALDYGQYRSDLLDGGTVQIGVSKGGESCFDLPSSSPDFGQKISAYYFWLFPNMMFNFYPWGLSINVIRPLAVDRSKVSFYPYVWDPMKVGEGAGAALDRVEREDEVVVELVQKGVRSRLYDRGRYSTKREDGVHHFHLMLSRSMGL